MHQMKFFKIVYIHFYNYFIFKRVIKLFSQENTWCKESYSKNIRGVQSPIDGLHSCSWCILGAIIKFNYDSNKPLFPEETYLSQIKFVYSQIPEDTSKNLTSKSEFVSAITDYNDKEISNTYEAYMFMFSVLSSYRKYLISFYLFPKKLNLYGFKIT
jgi:hypothetical protein